MLADKISPSSLFGRARSPRSVRDLIGALNMRTYAQLGLECMKDDGNKVGEYSGSLLAARSARRGDRSSETGARSNRGREASNFGLQLKIKLEVALLGI